MAKKSDAATIDRRVDTIATLILNGETTSKILRNATVRRWNVTPRQVETYIARAREDIRARGQYDKVDEFGKAIARYERIFNLAIEGKDLSTARATVKDLCQLYGISGPIHVKVEGGVTITNFAELATLAAEADQE